VPRQLVHPAFPGGRRHPVPERQDDRLDADDGGQRVGRSRAQAALRSHDAGGHREPGHRHQQIEVLRPLGLVDGVDHAPEHGPEQ
jgi:hypothetical protein